MITSRKWLFILVAFLFVTYVQAADDDDDDWDAYSCNSTTSCPEKRPCCSQYGICGTGAYCLGGCDIRFSFSLDSCMPQPVMDDYTNDFSNSSIFKKQDEYLGHADETDWVYTGYLDTSDDALLLQMPNGTTGTVVSSTKYLFFGKVSATMKSSRDKGVITAFILFSDVQDEIDYEFVGYDLTHPQSNYYAQGILNYSNSENSTTSDTFENYHDYEIDWQEEKIDWYIDGDKVRTLKKEDTWNATTKKYDYPQTPARVQFSLWPGGDSRNGLGTIEWAGGAIDWDSEDIQKYGYYYAFVKNITIEPYDIPSYVEEVDSDDGGDDFDAFLYNSTKGLEDNIILTNKKTWLGSGDATGLDPDNDSDDESSSKSDSKSSTKSKSSGSQTKTSGTSTKTAIQVPGEETNTKTATGTTIEYNPSAGIGGFVQNSEETDTSSTTTSGSGATQTVLEGAALILAMAIGFFAI